MSTQAARGTLRSVLHGAAALAAFMVTTAAVPTVASAKGRDVCIVYASSDSGVIADVKKKLDDTKLFQSVTNIDAGSSTPSASTLAACDSVLVYADTSRSGFSYSNDIGNALANYVDQGGGVVMVNPYYAGNSYYNVYSANWDKYVLIEPGSMNFTSSSSMGTYDMTHPIMSGISKVSTNGSRCYQRAGASGSAIRSGAKVVAAWADGNALVVVGTPQGKPRVDLNMYPAGSDIGSSGCYDPTSDASKLIANALLFVANPLKVSPQPVDFGTVPQGTTALPISVDITNSSSDPVTLTGGVLAPTGTFVVTGATYPKTLASGEKMTLSVTALPMTIGKLTATYTISQSGVGAPPTVVSLAVTGQGPVFDVQPSQINFGGVPVGKTAAPVTVTVTNTGGGYLSINPSPTLSDATNFGLDKVPGPLPTLLGAGASISFDVKFTPTAETLYNAQLRIPYSINGTNYTGTVTLRGSLGKPKIQVPTAIVLSPVRVNQTGPEQLITVTNGGLADLTISALTFSGGDASDFGIVSMPPLKIAPNGGTGTISVQCNPTVQGLRSSTLSINSDDPVTPTAMVVISCKGTVANFNLQPDKIDFSTTQQTGTCSPAQNVVISNSGTDTLRILGVSMTGTNPGSFKYTLPMGVKGVPPTGTYTIPVQFCPVDIGAQSASLTIATDLMAGHTAKVPLTGTASGPQVTVTPGNLDFGAVYIKTTSAAKQIMITNTGDQPLVFGKSTVTPAMPGGVFTVSGLPPDGTMLKKTDAPIVLTVTAAPLLAMQQTGDIAIVVNDQVKMGLLHIPLAVTGVQANISVSPMMMSFPVTILGQTSMEQTLTVTNTGAAPLTGLTLSVAGTNATDFLTSGMPPMMIPTGQSATFKVSFRPTGNGMRSGIVVVNAAGLTTPTQIKTDGTGKLLTINCTPGDKDLGKVVVGNTAALKVICTNSDTAAIDYVASFSDNLDDWMVDPATGNLPAASGADQGLVTLNVTFTPTGTGARTTTLTIKTKDGIAIGTINLDGTGQAAPKPKTDDMGGCAYSGRGQAQAAAWLLLLLAVGTLLVRRRRYSL